MSAPQSWTRVRDLTTGHVFDVQTTRLDQAGGSLPGMEVLADHPVHVGARPRRTKHKVHLDALPPRDPDHTPADAPAAGTDAAPAADHSKEH